MKERQCGGLADLGSWAGTKVSMVDSRLAVSCGSLVPHTAHCSASAKSGETINILQAETTHKVIRDKVFLDYVVWISLDVVQHVQRL